MRMSVACPVCSTRLVFEVLPQYVGRTVRVICTGCQTPIDASTEQAPSMPVPQLQHANPNFALQRDSRMNLANGLASRMQGQGLQPDRPGYGGGAPQLPAGAHKPLQQQQQQQQRPAHNSAGSGAGKPTGESLKYEVQCPNKEVRAHCPLSFACAVFAPFQPSVHGSPDAAA
jgi:hypothetical protein